MVWGCWPPPPDGLGCAIWVCPARQGLARNSCKGVRPVLGGFQVYWLWPYVFWIKWRSAQDKVPLGERGQSVNAWPGSVEHFPHVLLCFFPNATCTHQHLSASRKPVLKVASDLVWLEGDDRTTEPSPFSGRGALLWGRGFKWTEMQMEGGPTWGAAVHRQEGARALPSPPPPFKPSPPPENHSVFAPPPNLPKLDITFPLGPSARPD